MNIKEFRQQYPQYKDVPDEELSNALHKKYYSDVPYDEFASAFGVTTQDETSVLGYAKEIGKAVPRGFIGGFLTAGEGLAELADAGTNAIGLEGLIDSGSENALVYAARQGQEALDSALGVDEAYKDAWAVKFGEGVGSFATFLVPGGAAKLAGYAVKAAPKGATMGQKVAQFAKEVAPVAPLAVGVGAGEQAQRIEQARQSGIDVSQGQEDAAILAGGIVGVSELLPVERLLRRIPAGVPDEIKDDIFAKLKSAAVSGTIEGVQEVSAGIAQDLVEKGLYNPDAEVGESFWDELTVGGAVGALADLAVNYAAGRRNRLSDEASVEREKQLRELQERARVSFLTRLNAKQMTAENNAIIAQQLQEAIAAETDPNVRAGLQREFEIYSQYARTGESVDAPKPNNASQIAPPEPVDDPYEFGRQYARLIADTMGESFPASGSFTIQQSEVVDTEAGPIDTSSIEAQIGSEALRNARPVFSVIDENGNQYGSVLNDYQQAASLAGNLNEEVFNAGVSSEILNILENAPEAYDPETADTLFTYGWRILNPKYSGITFMDVNRAAGTTADKGYLEPLSFTDIQSGTKKRDGSVDIELPDGRVVNTKGLTAAQRINQKRVERGLPETRVFSVQEVRDELGENFENVQISGVQPAPAGMSAKAAITDLLAQKNINTKLESKEFSTLVNLLTGRNNFKDLTKGESALLFQRLSALPRFDKPTKLPDFTPKPYTREQFKLASQFLQDANGNRAKPTDQDIAAAAGIPDADPRLAEKVSALKTDLARQGVRVEQKPLLALPAPSGDSINDLRDRLAAVLKGYGLEDIGLRLNQTLTLSTGDLAREGTEAAFDINTRDIFLAVDRVDPDGTLTPEQRLNALSDIMGHEIIHAVRMLDLWTADEWSTLEKAVANLKKEDGRTYLETARQAYSDQPVSIQVEEAIADLARDYNKNKRVVGGRPRSMIERMFQFFSRLRNALNGTGFRTYEDVFNALSSGEVGARQRGEIRSLRATEEAMGAEVPERLRPLFGGARPAPRGRTAPPAATQPAATQPTTGQDFFEGDLEGVEVRESRKELDRAGRFPYVKNRDGSIEVKGDPDSIRESLPSGVKGRKVQDGLLFTSSDASRVISALNGEKITYGRAGQVLDKLPIKDGKYVGAPEKYNTPAKISTLRRNLMKLTKEGEYGRFWYEDSGRAVLDYVGGNLDEARKFLALLSIYSPQAKVDTNATFAIRAWAQYKAGQPINVKTGEQDAKAQAALDDVEGFWSGEKTGNFVNNLLRIIDPTLPQGATIDMWMMRAAEYKSDAPTKTQYAFMENEINRIARDLGWEPQQVQAAIWVAMKARMENKQVKKETEDSSEKKGWIRFDKVEKNGKLVKRRVILDAQKHRDNWLSRALKHTPNNQDKFDAGFHFGDGLNRHVGQISFEARPGRSTGVLPGIHSAPYAQQVEFQQAIDRVFYDENTGADLIASYLGLLTDSDIMAPGVWQGEVSPSSQRRMVMAPAKGQAGQIDPAQSKLLTVYTSLKGLLVRQEGVGWHKPYYATSKSRANGLDIDIGRPLTPNEAVNLNAAIGQWMINNNKGKSWEDGFAMISSSKGMRLVNFGVVDNATLQRDILSIAETVLPDFDYRIFSSDGDMPSNKWKEDSNGEGYIQRIRAEGRSDVLDWARDVLAPRVQSVFEEFSSKYGWGEPGSVPLATKAPVAEEVIEPSIRESRIPQPALDQAKREAVRQAEQYPPGAVPYLNANASPEALHAALNKDSIAPLDPEIRARYSRRNEPDYNNEEREILDRMTSPNLPDETPGETFLSATSLPEIRNLIDKFRKEVFFNYSRLEFYNKYDKRLAGNLADVSSLAAAEFADRAKAILAEAIVTGVVVYENGITKVKDFVHNGRKYQGLLGVMAPVLGSRYGNLERLAQSYAIARRGARLTAEGKMAPGKPEDLAKLERIIDQYTDENGNSIIREWYDAWQAYNENTIKFMRDTGMVDEQTAELWRQTADYIPYYKLNDKGDAKHPRVFGGMTSTTMLKSVGKSESAIDTSLVESVLMNLDAAITMGMKNVAQQRIVRDMITIGQAEMVRTGQEPRNNNIVTFKVRGKKVSAAIYDDLIFESMQAIPDLPVSMFVESIIRAPAQVLRELIIREPSYMMANMMRDTASVAITSGANFTPVVDTVKGFVSGLDELSRYGIVSGYDFNKDPESAVQFMSQEALKRGIRIPVEYTGRMSKMLRSRYMKPMMLVWDALGSASTRSEASTRKAVYDATLKRIDNEAEAAYQAMSIINYGRRGRNPYLRLLTAAVPFLNARLQGLDVLFRAATGTYSARSDFGRKRNILNFVTRATIMVGITAFYWSMVSDDEEYENQSEENKDNYYFLPIKRGNLEQGVKGYAVKIPIPFEVGVLFKVIPERILEYTHGEIDKRSLKESMKRSARSLYVTPTSLIPQTLKPLIEVATNYDFYTKRQIVPSYMELDMRAAHRSRFSTNELAVIIGEKLNISPMKLEHLMEGYLGSLGVYTLDVVDALLREGDREYPARRLYEYPPLRRFITTNMQPGMQNQFYDMSDQIDEVVGSMNQLIKDGRVDELQAHLIREQSLLQFKDINNDIRKMLQDYRQSKQAILKSDMDPETKREMIDELDRNIALSLRVVPELRKKAFGSSEQ